MATRAGYLTTRFGGYFAIGAALSASWNCMVRIAARRWSSD
jgi:hypothetical protein